METSHLPDAEPQRLSALLDHGADIRPSVAPGIDFDFRIASRMEQILGVIGDF